MVLYVFKLPNSSIRSDKHLLGFAIPYDNVAAIHAGTEPKGLRESLSLAYARLVHSAKAPLDLPQ